MGSLARRTKVGSLVGRGETVLNTVSQLNPILFRCAIAEAEYLRLARRGADRDKSLEKKFGVELILADGTVFPHKGRLDAIERAVDPTTGTLTGSFAFPIPRTFCAQANMGKLDWRPMSRKAPCLYPNSRSRRSKGSTASWS